MNYFLSTWVNHILKFSFNEKVGAVELQWPCKNAKMVIHRIDFFLQRKNKYI